VAVINYKKMAGLPPASKNTTVSSVTAMALWTQKINNVQSKNVLLNDYIWNDSHNVPLPV
jgi:hypothetical protein